MTNDSFRTGRVKLIEGKEDGYVELEGSPDMVLEVVSDSSVEKDNDVLMDLYWKAGIREYWVLDVNARQLLVHHDPVADATAVFGFAYRTVQTLNANDSVSPSAVPTAVIRVVEMLP